MLFYQFTKVYLNVVSVLS